VLTSCLERPATDRAYFTDSDGVRWRVHDCCFGAPLAKPGHRKRLPLEAPGTNTRYFVNEKGDQHAYALKRCESRRLTVDTCARQFAESGYCSNGPLYQGPTSPA
jgi:hypothetical protein